MELIPKNLAFEDIAELAEQVAPGVSAGDDKDEPLIVLPDEPAATDELVLIALDEADFRQQVANAKAEATEEVVDLDEEEAPPSPEPRKRRWWQFWSAKT